MSRYYRAGIILLVSLGFTGCTNGQDDEKNVKAFRLPVLAECENFVKTYFTEGGVGTAIKSKYFSFDRTLKSHPSVVGYLEIYTEGVTDIGIESSVNGIIWDCYPETAISIDANDHDFPQKIKDRINTNKKFGFLNNYIVSEEGKIKVYWHQKPDVIYKGKN